MRVAHQFLLDIEQSLAFGSILVAYRLCDWSFLAAHLVLMLQAYLIY
jgi:hypothetical protein